MLHTTQIFHKADRPRSNSHWISPYSAVRNRYIFVAVNSNNVLRSLFNSLDLDLDGKSHLKSGFVTDD